MGSNLVQRITGRTLALGELEIDCKYLPWNVSLNLGLRPTGQTLEDNSKSIVSIYHGV